MAKSGISLEREIRRRRNITLMVVSESAFLPRFLPPQKQPVLYLSG